MQYDSLVVGAGIWGCVIARRLADIGKRVLLIDSRNVIGGNCACEIDEYGIERHLYGCHIFHTSIPSVWEFVNRFSKFNGYQHHVVTSVAGKTYFMPVGLSLINSFFNVSLTPTQVDDFMSKDGRRQLLFDTFFKGYTSKQWNIPIDKVDQSVFDRIPFRSNYDINYFNDYNQGIPVNGYNELFANIVKHPGIDIKLNYKFTLDMLDRTIPTYYSGPLDELFNYKFGELPWRSLRFEAEYHPVSDFQGTAVVNYPDVNIPYTRIHEHKHFHPENKQLMDLDITVIVKEYSLDWKPGMEPYYPIQSVKSAKLYQTYLNESKRYSNLTIGGRLGEYKYYDMDKTIFSALNVDLVK